ncbi:hypothetical protein KDX14_33190 [Burkholderia cenocepacia]|uniref:hypothetical protein n=1 Tax=Burkholderia cenocepacia TaxID=95486 RepID=UPI001B9A1C08|nr:hypothetical protein [Burkholderia cenocepacia]MBR8074382.1 hypothetical protein [Burkholderia cenocepacia]
MSMDGVTGETCAAQGCPMLGSFGVSGKWFCCCHFRGSSASSVAVTSVLIQHAAIVDRVKLLRRTGGSYADILAAENSLIELTREVGRQYEIGGNGA